MAETFDTVKTGTPDGSSGNPVAGDLDTTSSNAFVCCTYLVYGATGGPYERVNATTPLPTKGPAPATSAVTAPDASPSSGTLLAANANRLGAAVYNNTALDLYLKLGSAATASSFTLVVAGGAYYEVPFGYTGIVTGLWPGAAGSGTSDGNALVTELTA